MKQEIEWFSPKDKLPEIPKGKHAVSVMMVVFDDCYNSVSNGKGSDFHTGIWQSGQFKNLYLSGWGCKRAWDWHPVFDEVIAWAYTPNVIGFEKSFVPETIGACP